MSIRSRRLSTRSVAFAALVSAVAATQGASAAIITFSQQFVWEAYAATRGASFAVESFDSYAGFYPGSLNGAVGGVNWSASAAGGIYVGAADGSQVLSTNNAVPLVISFSGAPARGVGGRFFGTDINFNVVPSIVEIALDDGTSYVGLISASSQFTGFYSTTAAITSITVSASPLPGSSEAVFPTVDDLRFAVVPTPGAFALLAAAGLVRARRRRA